MVYSDKKRRFLTIAIVLVIVGALVYLLAGERLREIFTTSLQTQVVALQQSDQDYLLNLPNATGPIVADNVKDDASLQQLFIETLAIHIDEFDETSRASALDYLQQYYDFPAPIPAGVQASIDTSVDKFLQTAPFLNGSNSGTPITTTTGDHDDFITNLLTIMANYNSRSNKDLPVPKAQAMNSLLQAFVNEL